MPLRRGALKSDGNVILRRECTTLLQEAGFSSSQPGAAVVRYIRFGRWLVKLNHWREFCGSGHFRFLDLRRLRMFEFEASAATERSEVILLREQGRPKIGVFSIREGHKDVRLVHNFDFRQEVAAMEDFARRHVLIPEVLSVDPSQKCYSQRLVGNPLTQVSPTLLPDAEAHLLALAYAGEIEFQEALTFITEAEAAIRHADAYLPESTTLLLRDILERFGADMLPRMPLGVPLMRCHGDFSLGNLLKGDDGRIYLIDLDRSFLAGPLFDAVYFGLISRASRARVRRLVEGLMHVPQLAVAVGSVDVHDYSRVMMAIDLARFLAFRYRALQAGSDGVCNYSVWVLQRFLKGWGRSV